MRGKSFFSIECHAAAFRNTALLGIALLSSGCPSKESAKGEPPPPPPPSAAAVAGACASGGGEVKDSIATPFFPRTTSGYCLDPNGETKTFGEGAKHPKEDVCTSLFDGECEVYFGMKLTRVVALRYVDGAGKGSSVDVYLSTFADPNGAYGMFAKRVIAGSDPADESAPKAIAAGAAAAMGTGRAYVYKGQYLAELQYNNEQESPDQLAKSSGALLPVLAKEIGSKLPGPKDLPASAKALPEAGLVTPVAIDYVGKEPLGLKALGPTAIGYYKDGKKRYRLAATAYADADQAKDAMKTIVKRPEALPLAGVGDEAAHVVVKEGERKVDCVFARKGALVAGVVADDFGSPEEQLTKDERVQKLKGWLSGASAATPSSSPAASGSSAPKPAPSSSAAPKK